MLAEAIVAKKEKSMVRTKTDPEIKNCTPPRSL
jgi:hypothetical protein